MSATTESTALLATPSDDQTKVLIQEEFVDDEKGKMNTLEVQILVILDVSSVWILWRELLELDRWLFLLHSTKYLALLIIHIRSVLLLVSFFSSLYVEWWFLPHISWLISTMKLIPCLLLVFSICFIHRMHSPKLRPTIRMPNLSSRLPATLATGSTMCVLLSRSMVPISVPWSLWQTSSLHFR